MSAERTVAKNAAWLVVQPLVMNLLSLAATGYISRRLGTAEFGRFNLALAFVALFGPLTNLGIRSLAIRHVARHRDTAAEYLGKVLVLRALLALITAAVIVVAAPLSGGSGETRAVILISTVGMVITAVSTVFIDAFQSFELMRPVSVAQFAGGMLLTVASVAVLLAGGGIRSMALAYTLGPVCTLGLLSIGARRLPFRPRLSFDLPGFGAMLRQASPFFGIVILDVASTRVDVVALARALGDAHLGCYTAAMSLVDRATVLADGAATALLPAIAHLSAQTPPAAVRLLRRSALWLLLLSVPVAMVTTALAPLVIAVIFGAKYAAAAPILAIGIWRLPAMCLAVLAGQSLFAAQRQDLELRTDAMAMVASIALIFVFVYTWGPAGGALALITRYAIALLLRLPAVLHYYPEGWPWGKLARVGAALALMSVPLAFVPRPPAGARHWASLLPSVGLVLAAGAIYFVCLSLLGVVPVVPLLRQLCRRRPARPARTSSRSENPALAGLFSTPADNP